MKITNALATAAAVAAAGSVGIIGAPIASADDATTTIGSQAKLMDGNVVQGWTITDLKTSTDPIPYPVAGTLWEATATDEAIQGSATPIVSNLNARAKSGQTYRVLFGVATPQGVNPATLAQGEKTTGKVYFDVTGDTPDSVVYNAGGQDLVVWLQAPPATQAITPYSPAPTRRPDLARSGIGSGDRCRRRAAALRAAPAAPLPTEGRSARPPLPTGSPARPSRRAARARRSRRAAQGTPASAGTEAAPVPASVAGRPRARGQPGHAASGGQPGHPGRAHHHDDRAAAALPDSSGVA